MVVVVVEVEPSGLYPGIKIIELRYQLYQLYLLFLLLLLLLLLLRMKIRIVASIGRSSLTRVPQSRCLM